MRLSMLFRIFEKRILGAKLLLPMVLVLAAILISSSSLQGEKIDWSAAQNDTQVQKEKKFIENLKKIFKGYQKKYASIRNMDFSNLEARTQRAQRAFNDARARGASPEELERLRLNYYKALHFEWSQKVYTYESNATLTWTSLKEEYIQLLYEDIAYVCDQITIEDVLPCLKKDGKIEDCLSFSTMIQSTLKKAITGTWKLRFVKNLQRELGCPAITAEYIWGEFVVPSVEKQPGEKLIKVGGEYLQEKGKEQLIKAVKSKMNKTLPDIVNQTVAKSGKAVEEVIEEESKKRAEDIATSVAFGSDIFWEGIKLYLNEQTLRQIMPTIKKRLEIARKAAAPNTSDQRVDYYFRNPDQAMSELIHKKKSLRTLPSVDPGAPTSTYPAHITKLDGFEKKKKKKTGSKKNGPPAPDYAKYKALLESARGDFKRGRLYFDDYLGIISRIESLVFTISSKYVKSHAFDGKGEIERERRKRFGAYLSKLRKEIWKKYIDTSNRLKNTQQERKRTKKKLQAEILAMGDRIDRAISGAQQCSEKGDIYCYQSNRREFEKASSRLIKTKKQCDESTRKAFVRIGEIVAATPGIFYENGLLKSESSLNVPEGQNQVKTYSIRLSKTETSFVNGLISPENIECKILRKFGGGVPSVRMDWFEEMTKNRIAQKVTGEIARVTGESLRSAAPVGRKEIAAIGGTAYFRAIQDNFDELMTRHAMLAKVVEEAKDTAKKAIKVSKKAQEETGRRSLNLLALELKYRLGKISTWGFLDTWKREVLAIDRVKEKARLLMKSLEASRKIIEIQESYASEESRLERMASFFPEKVASGMPKADIHGFKALYSKAQGMYRPIENPVGSLSAWKSEMTKADGMIHRALGSISSEDKRFLRLMLKHSREGRMGLYHHGYVESVDGEEYLSWIVGGTRKDLLSYAKSVTDAYERNEKVYRSLCKKGAKLARLMKSLNARYDGEKFREADRLAGEIYYGEYPLAGYAGRRFHGLEIFPNLRLPCSAKDLMEAIEGFYHYVALKDRKMPDRVYSEVRANNVPIRAMGSPVDVEISQDRTVDVEVGGVPESVQKQMKSIGVKICALPALSIPKYYQQWKTSCESKPFAQMQSRHRIFYTKLLVDPWNTYRVYVKVRMKDRREHIYEAGDFRVVPRKHEGRGGEEESGGGGGSNLDIFKGRKREHNWPSCKLYALGYGGNSAIIGTGGFLILYATIKQESDVPVVHSSWSWVESKSGKYYDDNRIKFDFSDPEIERLQRQGLSAVKVSFFTPGSYIVLHYGSDQVAREFKCDYRVTVRGTAKAEENGGINSHTGKKRKRDEESARGEKGKKSTNANKHEGNTGYKTDQSNRCKPYYRVYVKDYNRITKLMSSGRGDTREAKKAYRAYQRSRQLYLSCKKNLPKPEASTHIQSHKKMLKRAVYLGCYKDRGDPFSLSGRDLHAYGYNTQKLTIEGCQLTCARKGFHYAALQYAQTCICDNHYGKYGKASNCDMKCTGNPHEICGGSWANSVYDVSRIKPEPISYHGMERSIDRLGGDYRNFDLPRPDPRLCQEACEKDSRCKAWTYVKPNTFQGPHPRCWLKNVVPPPKKNNACISGVKAENPEVSGENKPGTGRKHTVPGGKNVDETINNCKKYYRNYIDSYNRVTQLMSSGKGDTEEAKKAYKVYKRTKSLYLSCQNRSESKTVIESHPIENGKSDSGVIYNTAEGGENFTIDNPTSSSGRTGRGEGIVLVDTVDMLSNKVEDKRKSGSVGKTETRSGKAKHCATAYSQYLAAYQALTRAITDSGISDLTLLKHLHGYRKAWREYSRCTGVEHKPSRPAKGSASTYDGLCAAEFKAYEESYERITEGMNTLDDLPFIRLRQAYLRAKKSYELCLNRKEKPRQEMTAERVSVKDRSPKGGKKVESSTKRDIIVYAGSKLNNAIIATRKLPSGEPDGYTITDHLPNGSTPFYLFVYYEGVKPTDRIGVHWYYRPFGGKKEMLLFEEKGGRLPAEEGVFSAGPISIEGGSFPSGEYHLILTLNGKKEIEKFFTIGEGE